MSIAGVTGIVRGWLGSKLLWLGVAAMGIVFTFGYMKGRHSAELDCQRAKLEEERARNENNEEKLRSDVTTLVSATIREAQLEREVQSVKHPVDPQCRLGADWVRGYDHLVRAVNAAGGIPQTTGTHDDDRER